MVEARSVVSPHPSEPGGTSTDCLATIPSDDVTGKLWPLRRFAARQHLWLEGEQRTSVYVVQKGAVIGYKMLPDGRRSVVDLALPGQIVGLGGGEEHDCFAQASIETTVRLLSKAALQSAFDGDPSVRLHLIRLLIDGSNAARMQLFLMGRRTAVERVAAFLINVAVRDATCANTETVMLPLRRGDLADYLGLSLESTSRAFSTLKAERVISQLSLYRFQILDRKRLETFACDATDHDRLF